MPSGHRNLARTFGRDARNLAPGEEGADPADLGGPGEGAGPAGGRRPWHHENPRLAALLALAVLGALLAVAVVLLQEAREDEPPAGAPLGSGIGFAYDPFCYQCDFTLVHYDMRQYVTFVDVTVRPTLVTVVATMEPACEGGDGHTTHGHPMDDPMFLQETLGTARGKADQALQQLEAVVPPAALHGFHERTKEVFREASAASAALSTCAAGQPPAGSTCDDVRKRADEVQARAAGLAKEASQMAAGL